MAPKPRPAKTPRLPSAVEWAHLILSRHLPAHALVVDATAGNGHDSLFLASHTGLHGHLFAFDIQPAALERTRQVLLDQAVDPDRFTLIHSCHTFLDRLLPAEYRGHLDAILFNLGYLPGASKQHTTQPASTLHALQTAAEWLKIGGLLSVVAYPGHATGSEEAAQVAEWMLRLPSETFEVQTLQAANRKNSPPQLWVALKIGATPPIPSPNATA